MTVGGTPLNVVPEEVKAIGRFAYGVAEELKAGSISLDREVQSLFTTWKGSAAEAYRTGWDDMQDGALKAWDALTDLAAKLGVSSSAYQDQDDVNASSYSSLQLD